MSTSLAEVWPPWSASPSALCAALAIDVLSGELPARFHPVVWIGRFIRSVERRLPGPGARAELLGGALLALVVPLGCAGLTLGQRAAQALAARRLVVSRAAAHRHVCAARPR